MAINDGRGTSFGGPGELQGGWQSPADDLSRRPTGELVKELFSEAQHLIRGEVALAKAEVRHEAKKVGRGAGALGAAGLLGHGAFLAFTAGLVLLLGTFMPWWLGALIVAAGYGVAAAVLGKSGVEKIKAVHPPERTIQSLKEDRRWATEAIRNAKSDSHANA